MSTVLPESVPSQRPARPVCEFKRAHRELLGVEAQSVEDHGCSPDTPEPRAYPVSVSGGRPFVLCNGHLRDVFSALEHRPDLANSQVKS